MVTPIVPHPLPSVAKGVPAKESAPEENRARRIANQAEQIIQQEKLTGAEAMRVRNMIQLAKVSDAQGNNTDAERVAREALRTARNLEEDPRALAPGDEVENSDPTASPETEIPSSSTPEAQSNQDGDTFERETTNYTDGSADGGISFQYAQPLTPEQAPLAIAAHESSHLRRESREAIINGQRVLQSVRYSRYIDPNSGEFHIAGGHARTIIFPKKEMTPLEEIHENATRHLDLQA